MNFQSAGTLNIGSTNVLTPSFTFFTRCGGISPRGYALPAKQQLTNKTYKTQCYLVLFKL